MDAGVVKDLQAALFPVCTKGGFLTSVLHNTLKSNQLEFNTDARTLRPVAKLKEPRDLFTLGGALEGGGYAQQAPRWPAECQVLEERVLHLQDSPLTPEVYYKVTGREVQPKPVGDAAGHVVFQYYPMSAVNYFSRSCVGGSKYLSPTSPLNSADDGLQFESRFESGNLAKVVRITDTYYELYLRTDLYTNRHMQWFYFRIENTRTHISYRFSIVNLSKAESLYSSGMKPLMFSTKAARRSGVGWRRCGDNIAYYRNENGSEDEQIPSFTLTFTVQFPYDNDLVYMAHCYPYTYSDLQDYLLALQNHSVKSTYTKLRLLCRSLAGNNVYYLTVTAPSNGEETRVKKKAVVVTARVHPGETPSSWMMKGVIDFLTGDSLQAKELREKFIFKLVPMLNPDGVIVGNNRCSLTGRDLNRQYRTVIRETYPPVWHTKLMVRRLMEECGVEMYCDLHAHSRKNNIFIYGCESRRTRLHEQVFPLMLHKNAADKFSFESCKFRVHRSKEGTGRVVIWMMGVANSFTMEASFGGSTLGGRLDTHFTTQDYQQMGKNFCETLLDFCDTDPTKERLRNKIMNRLLKEGSNADEPTNISLSDYSSDDGDTSSSSEEEVERRGSGDDCCPHLKVPPPSPVLPRREHKAVKSVLRTPPSTRRTLEVRQATITLPAAVDISSDAYDSDGLAPQTSTKLRGKQICSSKMPPELKVTSAQVHETDLVLLPSPSGTPELPAEKTRYQSWHHLRCVPLPRQTQRNVSDLTNELQTKIGSSLRQKIWTGIPCVCHSSDTDTHWSKTALVKHPQTANEENPCVQSIEIKGKERSPIRSFYNDNLLKSCSEKLENLQRKGLNTNQQNPSQSNKKNKLKSTKTKSYVTSKSLEETTTRLKHTKGSSMTKSLDESAQRKNATLRKKPISSRAKPVSSSDDERSQKKTGSTSRTNKLKVKKTSEQDKIKEGDLRKTRPSIGLKKTAKDQGKLKEHNKKKFKNLEKKILNEINENAVAQNPGTCDQKEKLKDDGGRSLFEVDLSVRYRNLESTHAEYVERVSDTSFEVEYESRNITSPEGVRECSECACVETDQRSNSERQKRSLKWKFHKSVAVTSMTAEVSSSETTQTLVTKNKKNKRKLTGKKTKSMSSSSSSSYAQQTHVNP